MGRGKQKAAKGGRKVRQNMTCVQQIYEAENEISSDEETTKNNRKAKKVKPKKTKKQLQKTLSESKQSGIESKANEEIQFRENEDSDTDSKDPNKKKDAWKKEWKEAGRTMDPNKDKPNGPKLVLKCLMNLAVS